MSITHTKRKGRTRKYAGQFHRKRGSSQTRGQLVQIERVIYLPLNPGGVVEREKRKEKRVSRARSEHVVKVEMVNEKGRERDRARARECVIPPNLLLLLPPSQSSSSEGSSCLRALFSKKTGCRRRIAFKEDNVGRVKAGWQSVSSSGARLLRLWNEEAEEEAANGRHEGKIFYCVSHLHVFFAV